jgi:hypothetical protein
MNKVGSHHSTQVVDQRRAAIQMSNSSQMSCTQDNQLQSCRFYSHTGSCVVTLPTIKSQAPACKSIQATMVCHIVRVKYGDKVRSFAMWENMSVSELAAIFKQVFRFEGEIVGLATEVGI